MYENNKPFLVKILKVLFKQWTKTYDIERIEEDIFDESGDVWSFMEKFTDILEVDINLDSISFFVQCIVLNANLLETNTINENNVIIPKLITGTVDFDETCSELIRTTYRHEIQAYSEEHILVKAETEYHNGDLYPNDGEEVNKDYLDSDGCDARMDTDSVRIISEGKKNRKIIKEDNAKVLPRTVIEDNINKTIRHILPSIIEFTDIKEVPSDFYLTSIDIFENKLRDVTFSFVLSIDTGGDVTTADILSEILKFHDFALHEFFQKISFNKNGKICKPSESDMGLRLIHIQKLNLGGELLQITYAIFYSI